jgi:hypothetical protein
MLLGEAHTQKMRDEQKEREIEMKKIARKTIKFARGTALTLGVAVMVALVLGVATTALAGTGVGARFQLGQTNTVNAITKLVGSVAGPSLQIDNNSTNAGATALDLQVEPGKAPMKVNSDAQVANLNSDKLDGKSDTDFYAAGSKVADSAHADQADSATSAQNADTVDGKSANEIGVNGLVSVANVSGAANSDSPKVVQVSCPAGKVVVGIGSSLNGGTIGTSPNQESAVVIKDEFATNLLTTVQVSAVEEEPTSAIWSVSAQAICATAP